MVPSKYPLGSYLLNTVVLFSAFCNPASFWSLEEDPQNLHHPCL